MVHRTTLRPTAERFVDVTLDLIAEQGGSHGVNLREVSRRVGCAHTNAYNYFAGFDDLLWHAFRRTLDRYAEHLAAGLDESLPPLDYLRRFVTNIATFPQEHPGWYRFIGSDPVDLDTAPADVFDTVTRMKRWMVDVFAALCGPEVPAHEAEDLCNITYAYIDGETLNLINGRVVPGEDIAARIVDNAVRLFVLFTAAHGVDLAGEPPGRSYPSLEQAEPDRSTGDQP